jgi:hypothetical protein
VTEPVTRAELEALLEKYRALSALRTERSEVAPTAALQALSARFPGALRELDQRPFEGIAARVIALEEALAGGAPPEWALVTSRFHGWLRVGLALRAAGVRALSDARRWAEHYAPRAPGDPTIASLDDGVLALLVAPPGGRLTRAAIALVAPALAEAVVEEQIFGRARRFTSGPTGT